MHLGGGNMCRGGEEVLIPCHFQMKWFSVVKVIGAKTLSFIIIYLETLRLSGVISTKTIHARSIFMQKVFSGCLLLTWKMARLITLSWEPIKTDPKRMQIEDFFSKSRPLNLKSIIYHWKWGRMEVTKYLHSSSTTYKPSSFQNKID